MLIKSLSFALALLIALSTIVAAAVPTAPPAFSADLVRRDANGSVVGAPAKLHVSELKTRIDTPEAPGGFFVTDASAATSLYVRPAQHVYMDARQSTPLTSVFVRVDPKNPCPQWQAAALIAYASTRTDWRCDPVRAAAVIDPVLHFPVKWRTADGGSVVLENVSTQKQPEQLFAIPAGFTKLDPRALIERIKRSDVWAPPT